MNNLDPVTFEIIKNSIDATSDEMMLALVHTAYSPNIRDGMDCSTAMCDARGQMVSQGVCSAVHLGSFPEAVEAVLEKFGGDIQPGDVYILNDPYTGGMHLPDVFAFKPVFIGDTLLAFLVLVGDQLDMGGKVPGSRPVDATEIFQEGLRIPPVRLFDAGKPVQAVWDIIAQNVRVPTKVIGDIRAFMAAFYSAEKLLKNDVDRFGLETIQHFFEEVQAYSERITRQKISEFPDGHYEFTDYVDDSVITDDPITIKLALDVKGDELYFDLTGTSPQIKAGINCTLSYVKSAVYAAVRTLMPPDMPNNSGFFRPIKIFAPLGCIANPTPPSPVAMRGIIGFRVLDAALGALAQVVSDRVPAASEGGTTVFRLGGYDENNRAFVMWDSVAGTRGACPHSDGIDGCAPFAANSSNVPVEVIESEFPVRINKYGLRQDSGGPGKYRGGLGLEREWKVLSGEVLISVRADRVKFLPWGLKGGRNGIASRNVMIDADGRESSVAAKATYRMTAGQRFFHQQASAGGYGDPLERDPQLVLRDWRNEKVTAAHARDQYGVVIDESSGLIDRTATEKLRSRLRKLTTDGAVSNTEERDGATAAAAGK